MVPCKAATCFAIFLVLTALITRDVWNPNKDNLLNDRAVMVKDRYEGVVVEYEKESDGNTKGSISPQEGAKEKVQSFSEGKENGDGKSPTELVCDAFGKRKEKIASALGKNEEKVAGKAQGLWGKVSEVKEDAKETPSEAVRKLMEAVEGKVKDAGDKAKNIDLVGTSKRIVEHIEGNVSRKIDEMKEPVKEKVNEAREMVEKVAATLTEEGKEKVKQVGEMAEKVADSVKDGYFRVTEEGKEMAKKAADGVKDSAYTVKEEAKEKAKVGEIAEKTAYDVKDGAYRVKEEGKEKQKFLSKILGRLVWPNAMDSLMGIVHLFGFSMAFGMGMWVTFVCSNLLHGALPMDQFGMVQSRLYPVYYRLQSIFIVLALTGHMLSHRKRFFSSRVEMYHGFNLLASLLVALGNLLYLEPRATKLMFERLKLEKEEGRGRATLDPRSGIADDAGDPKSATTERQEEVEDNSRSGVLRGKLKMLNKVSSFLNMSTLLSLVWHLVYLGQRLHVKL